VAKLINQGSSIVEGIENVFSRISGSCSLLLLNADGVYAARDRLGYTSLSIGESEDGLAVASETCAFVNNGFKIIKDIGPGEIVLLSENALLQKKAPRAFRQVCAFYWIYAGFPASSYEGINAEIVRERCGRSLAKHDQGLDVDLVAGVPDSGIAHALGYAAESGKPYRRPLIKYTPGYGRSYTPPSQVTRNLVATMKLIPIEEIIKNNKIVICDDSIVRGTQLKNFTVKKLWNFGAKEIHVRSACPPLMFPCRFNLSTRSIHELAARKAIKALEGSDIEDVSEYIDSSSRKHQEMVKYIERDIEATSLRYQSVDDMVEAIGLSRDQLCLHCWTGDCPDREKLNCQSRSCAL
jgi:amidophosphoribosyltransferase